MSHLARVLVPGPATLLSQESPRIKQTLLALSRRGRQSQTFVEPTKTPAEPEIAASAMPMSA